MGMSGIEQAHKRADAAARKANPTWRNTVFEIIQELAMEEREFTSEDVIARIPEDITTGDTRAIGGLMKTAVRQKMIIPLGYTLSPKHGHPKKFYIGNV